MQAREDAHAGKDGTDATSARTSDADRGGPSRAAALLRLQRQAGNRAVAAAVAVQRVPVIGPAPTAIGAGEPLPGATADRTAQPLGDTRPTGSTTPQWNIRGTGAAAAGRWEGRVQPTTAGDVQIAARYPAPGVYPMAQGASTRPKRALVNDDVSELVRDGEQEHSNDFHLAHHNVYDTVATAINTLAAQPAKSGPNIGDVHRQWREELRAALPAPLQAPVSEISPNAPWTSVVARLNGLSNQRDTNHWHDMGAGFATHEERVAHHIPDTEEFVRILPGGQIGQHDSQARIDAAVPGLRQAPGASPSSSTGAAAPTSEERASTSEPAAGTPTERAAPVAAAPTSS